ncbi:C40 family peptidase [Nocardia sp. GCM10030253]|uniref:C40 family peptidase n=1 Tax=Nocardia sp. GCM10030253 TaxID=3273404 RepID=UPI003630297C
MAPELTGDLYGVMQLLLGLYGEGSPEAGRNATYQMIAADLNSHQGKSVVGYTDARGMHTSVAETHAGKDGVTHKAVAESGEGTVNGRHRLNNQIADLQARVQAISSVGDTRFSGPALLDAAQSTLVNATKRVNADVAAAQQQAARIMPPPMPQPRRRQRGTTARRRGRSRSRSSSRLQRRSMAPSDGTKGGSAVSAAKSWLGAPYIWGGGGAGGPSGGGFDCSGLTQYAIAQATNGEVVLPRTTYDQIYSGVRVHPNDVQPGDLVFPGTSFSSRGPEHVQLAAGNGMVIEAPYSGSTVKYSRMSSDAVVVRVL